MRPGLGWLSSLLLPAALMTMSAGSARAQSLMERTPNVSGGWVGNSGQVYFNFLHRFVASPEPARKVTNFPTFTFAFGLPARTLIGAHYATNSLLAPGYPNEWELFVRNRPFAVASGAPLDLAVQVGYNLASDGVDGELSIGRALGPVQPTLALRVLADPFEAGGTQLAAAGGAVVRLHRYVALAGDVGTLFDEDSARLAWSAGVHFALPYTPHTLSLHASNTNNTTLQGSSRGERTRWGFEFTVPITLARWFAAGDAEPVPVAERPAVRVDTIVVIDTVIVTQEVPAPAAHVAPPADSTPRPAVGLVPDSARRAPRPGAVPDSARPAPPARADTVRTPPPAAPPRPQQPAAPPVRSAEIRGLAFAPARIEVARGTTIEWTNRDQVEHSVTARDGSFDSGLIRPGARFRRTFDRAGTYEIYCRPHPFMRLVVVVR